MISEEKIILQLKNITKRFPGVLALNKISCEIYKGEVHILLGENGAGKSTLVKILSGAYNKDEGEIYLLNQIIDIKNPKQSREIGIGVIYQELNLIPQLTVAENIFLGREFSSSIGFVDDKKIEIESEKILKELDVEIDASELVSNLGTAQQQMVEIAKALSLKSKVLIMDEPTSSLTKKEIKQLFLAIEKLKKNGVAIIYISHRLEEIFEIGDRVSVLRDGNLITTRLINETNYSDLIKLMVNRDRDEQFPKRKYEKGKEVLRAVNLSARKLIREISFSLFSGEILGIYGLLGSGRTELAQAVFGINRVESGDLFIEKKSKSINSPRNAIKEGIGFLTEDRKTGGLFLDLPVKENITITSLNKISEFSFISSKKEKNDAERFIKDLNIKTTGSDQNVRYLSGGNQQKVVFAKWLNSDAKIFIFDEPTRGIDIGAKQEIYELMNKLIGKGCGIIMISSELPEIIGMSDRIIVMYNGRISGEFDRSQFSQERILSSALGEIYAN